MAPGDPPIMTERRRPVEEWDIVVPRRLPGLPELRSISPQSPAAARQHVQLRQERTRRAARGAGAAARPGAVWALRTTHDGQPWPRVSPLRMPARPAGLRRAALPGVPGPPSRRRRRNGVPRGGAAGGSWRRHWQAFAVHRTRATRTRPSLAVAHRARPLRGRARAAAIRRRGAGEPLGRAALEARWNTALQALEKLQREYAVAAADRACCRSTTQTEESVRRLAADLPALWRAATTTAVDRKRLLRLVVTEVTLTTHPEQRQATFKCSGAVARSPSTRELPAHRHSINGPSAGVLERLAELARDLPDHQVAERLNAEGLRTRTGKAWTYARVLLDPQATRDPDRLPPGVRTIAASGRMVWCRVESQPSGCKSRPRSSISGSSMVCCGMISACLPPRSGSGCTTQMSRG